jgi:hypothetical protein
MNKSTDTAERDTAYAIVILVAAIFGYQNRSVALGIMLAVFGLAAVYGHSSGLWGQLWQWSRPYLVELAAAFPKLFVKPEIVVSEMEIPYQFSPGQEIESGQFIVTDLEEVGSFGVYAITRAGKSTLIKSLLYQLMTKNSPSELRFVISDLKDGLDFAKFRYLKHLALPIAETTKESELQINWLLKEKERRSMLFKAAPRFEVPSNLKEYHEINTSLGLERLPIILAIFDEFQNVTMENERALNGLVKIAKEGQAFGIYVVPATQLPMVEALPTKLKSQLASWFCGYLANPSDYYKVVQVPKDIYEPFHNAGKIKGKFIANIAGEMMVIQSIYIQPAELKRALKFYSNKNEPSWPEIEEMEQDTGYVWDGKNEDEKRAMLVQWLSTLKDAPSAEDAIEVFGFSRATFYNWKITQMWEQISTRVEK